MSQEEYDKDGNGAMQELDQARWNHLVDVAFRLSERLDKVDLSQDGLSQESTTYRLSCSIQALDDLLELFPREIDPIEDPCAFAVRRFAAAIRRSLVGIGDALRIGE